MTENNFYLGLSSNIDDKVKNLQDAVKHLEAFCKIKKISSLYETEPVGYKNQDWFINIALSGTTRYSALELLDKCLSIEKEMGRIRKIKNGPRNIDIDILFFNSEIIKLKNLKVPHPEIQNRNFVLTPLCEISPNLKHPELKKTVKELLSELKNPDQAKRLAEKSF